MFYFLGEVKDRDKMVYRNILGITRKPLEFPTISKDSDMACLQCSINCCMHVLKS